jgi:small conductance mechanosensitive channel
VAEACGAGVVQDVDLTCRIMYELLGEGSTQATLARIAGGLLELLLILAIALVLNRLARRALKRFVRGMTESGVARLGALTSRAPLADTSPLNLERATRRTETIAGVLQSIVTFGIGAITLALVLGVFGINLGPLLAGAGIVGVALGFGSQNLVRDFLSGVFMLLEDQYGVGDVIDVGEASGVVEGISLRTTRLRDVEGTAWYVPNGEIRRVGNKSQLWARGILDLRVAYDTDIAHALQVIKEVADEVWHDEAWSDRVIEEPEVWGIEQFGPKEVVIRLAVKVEPGSQWAVNREVRARLLAAFEREGIEIPDERVMLLRESLEDVQPADLADGAGPAVTGPKQ